MFKESIKKDAIEINDCSNVSSEHIINILNIGVVCFDTNIITKIINPTLANTLEIKVGNDLALFLENNTENAIWQGWKERILNAINTNQTAHFNNVSVRNKKQNYSILNLTIIPLQSPQTQQIIGGIMTCQDITEKTIVQRHLDSTERFAAVGKLAGKIAHELNNPMDGILRYINLTTRILEKENLTKPVEYLSQCKIGLMRMVQIISELLEFSRSTYNSFEKMSISDIIEEAIKSMEHKISSGNFTIDKDFDQRIPKIRCGNLYQVFCNLIKNSIDAMDGAGSLRISTCMDDKGFVIIDICDSGHGIDPANIDKLFEPFFTTKKNGKGTGLGLAICKDIIEKYDGRIIVSNNYDKGSTFSVIIPLSSMT